MATKFVRRAVAHAPGAGVAAFLKLTPILVVSDSVAFGDTSPVTAFTIPANSWILASYCQVTTAFAGTSPTLSLGVSGTTGRHMATGDITATTAGGYGVARPYRYTADTDLIVTIGGTGLSAGAAVFAILIVPDFTAQAYIAR